LGYNAAPIDFPENSLSNKNETFLHKIFFRKMYFSENFFLEKESVPCAAGGAVYSYLTPFLLHVLRRSIATRGG